jgi:hypothetical protein
MNVGRAVEARASRLLPFDKLRAKSNRGAGILLERFLVNWFFTRNGKIETGVPT